MSDLIFEDVNGRVFRIHFYKTGWTITLIRN